MVFRSPSPLLPCSSAPLPIRSHRQVHPDVVGLVVGLHPQDLPREVGPYLHIPGELLLPDPQLPQPVAVLQDGHLPPAPQFPQGVPQLPGLRLLLVPLLLQGLDLFREEGGGARSPIDGQLPPVPRELLLNPGDIPIEPTLLLPEEELPLFLLRLLGGRLFLDLR